MEFNSYFLTIKFDRVEKTVSFFYPCPSNILLLTSFNSLL